MLRRAKGCANVATRTHAAKQRVREVGSGSHPRAALAAASATHASIGTAGRPSAAAASAVTGVDPARSATDSDTEEDEEAVPGTPPDDYPNKRPCTDGAHGGSFDGSGW